MILALLSFYSLSITCFCKTYYRRPYPFSHKILQCSGVLILYIFQVWPILQNLIFTFILSHNDQELIKFEQNGLFWHLVQIILFVLSGLIFVARVPERFCPGLFDLFGQSHHAFHLTIFLTCFTQANAVYQDVLHISSNYIPYEIFLRDILLTLIVFCSELFIVFLWFRITRPTIEQRYKISLKNQ